MAIGRSHPHKQELFAKRPTFGYGMAMQIAYDDKRLRITVILTPVFRLGVLCDSVMEHITETVRELIIDSRWIEIMHSPFLGELVQLYCHLQKRGITMHLASISEANRHIFDMTRLDQLITLHDEAYPPEEELTAEGDEVS